MLFDHFKGITVKVRWWETLSWSVLVATHTQKHCLYWGSWQDIGPNWSDAPCDYLTFFSRQKSSNCFIDAVFLKQNMSLAFCATERWRETQETYKIVFC